MHILAADFVLPVSSSPIERGAVAIEGSRIAAVGPRDEVVRRFAEAECEDLGKAAILPGFVNCHSHLELTGLRNRLDKVEGDFREWLLSLNRFRAEMSDQQICGHAIDGAREGAAAGITCFGDIGRLGHAGIGALKEAGLRGIVFQETEFSPDNRSADEDFLMLAEKYEGLRQQETPLVKVGISPHSPYTVGSRLLELIAQYSILNRVPLTIHAAESDEEFGLLTRGEGFFTEVYERFDVEWQSPHCTPVEYLERLGVLTARPLLAHCVKVTSEDISRIANTGSKIAHCPKSNAKFGHGYAPFEAFLDAGIRTGLGSDSVVSNNICDLLEESRFAVLSARNRGGSSRFIDASEALRAATLGGASALGVDDKVGTLEAGKEADMAVVSLASAAHVPINDIEAALVFSSNGRDVSMTMVAGNVVYRRP